ncbi:MAG: hypothetical protein QXU87_04215 [Candidatus Caldarchaeum sp.]
MAKIVAAYASSHTPQLVVQPKISEEFTRQLQIVHNALMEVGRRIAAANADTVIVFGSDHMETFWLNNYPQLLLFTGTEVGGKFAGVELKLPSDPQLSKELLYGLIDMGFDVSFSHELELDHPYISPMYWVLKGAQHDSYRPKLVPFHVNSNVDPRIKPRRAFELGQAVRKVLESSSLPNRVALIATGGLSHFVGTPYYGKVDVEADNFLIEKMVSGRGYELADLTADWLDEHGEFEFRTWLAVIGAVNSAPAEVLAYQRAWHAGYCVMSFKL